MPDDTIITEDIPDDEVLQPPKVSQPPHAAFSGFSGRGLAAGLFE